MSDDRIAVLEERLAELEHRLMEVPEPAAPPAPPRAPTWVGPMTVGVALALASAGTATRAQSVPTSSTLRAPFQVVDTSGAPLFSVESVGSGTRVLVMDRGVGTMMLEAVDGSSWVDLGDAKGSHARIGMNSDDDGSGPSVRLTHGGEEILSVTSKATSIKTPLKVSPNGAPTLEVATQNIKATGAMSVRATDGTELVAMGRQPAGVFLHVAPGKAGGVSLGQTIGAGFVRVRGSDGDDGLSLGFTANGPELQVIDEDGVSVAASLGMSEVGAARLVVGDADGARAVLGKAQSGFVTLALYDSAVGTELSAGKEGGGLRVMDKTGSPVGGLFSSSTGGRLALTAAGSAYSAVSLGIGNGGGTVRVFSTTGGPARASLEADGNLGGVTAYDKEGRPAATLSTVSSGPGILQLLSNGVTMLEAGTTEDNLGLLRVGPVCKGVLGTFDWPCMVLGRNPK